MFVQTSCFRESAERFLTGCRLPKRWIIGGVAFFLIGLSALDAQEVWHGPRGTSSSWFNPANWSPMSLPTSDTNAIVVNGGTADIGLGQAFAANLRIDSNSTIDISAGSLTVSNPVLVGTEGRLLFSGGTLTATGANPRIQDNGIVEFSGTGNQNLSHTLTGIGGLTVDLDGTLFVFSSNNYGGRTLIVAGKLQAKSVTALSPFSAFTVNSGATLDLNGFNNRIGSLSGAGTVSTSNSTRAALTVGNGNTKTTFSGVLEDGAGVLQLIKSGTGTLTLTGNNIYTGGTTISAGTLQLGNDGTSGSIAGNVTDNGTLAFNRSDPVAFAGVISGAGNVVKLGPNTLTLTEDNTYTGSATISAGTLQLGNGGTAGSVAGNVTDNGTLAFDRSDPVTFDGVISGAGNVVKLGPNTLTFTGTNTYAGGTTINAGTLQLGNGGTTGSIAGNVLDNGTLAFNRSDSVTFASVISGSGNVVKLGTGTLTLPGTNTYTGTTTVNSGSLIVDGSIASAQTVVNPDGFLGGHGTIAGNLVNNGIIGQNNSPETLTIANNFTQNPGGTLRIGVAGIAPGQHDLLAVNGHAAVAGTLQFISLGGFALQPGDQITFLTAKNGISGSFNNTQNGLVSTGTIVQAQVTSLPDSIVLEGTQGSFANTPGVAITPNENSVAKALDSAVGDPRAAALFAFLNSQPLANLPNDLTLIAPTQITSINATAVSVAKVQIANVAMRLANVHAGSTGFSSAGLSINGGAASFGEGFAGVSGPEGKGGATVFAPTPDNRWGVFLTGLGEFSNVDSTPNALGYDVNTGGFTMGVDYRLTPNFALGLTAGYAHTSVGPDGGGNIDVNGGKLGAYATLFGNGFYLDTAVTGGPSGYHTRRTALQGTASGSTDGADFNVLVATGYDWKHGNLSIGPTATFQYSYVGLRTFTETGSLAPLTFPNQNTQSELTAFGGKATYEWKIGHVTVLPQISAAWQHEYGATAYSVIASFANGAGNSFTVVGPQIGRDSILVGAGASVILSDRVSTYLYYDGEFARTNYLSNNVSGGVRIAF
jgi:autotransporter-associated beta strand protein